MKHTQIRRQLKPQRVRDRIGSMRSQFQRAITDFDNYDELAVREAMLDLEQPDLKNLRCVYCHGRATNWDHVHNVGGSSVTSEGSSRGHRIRNLVPACKACDNAKGPRDVQTFFGQAYMVEAVPSEDERERRLSMILRYAEKCSRTDLPTKVADHPEYAAVLDRIIDLMAQADGIASRIRSKV